MNISFLHLPLKRASTHHQIPFYHFVSSIQAKYAVQPYMDKQEDLNNKMRSILVDWLVEVHFKFKLYPATLWLTVNIIDRFLSKVPIKRARLQLVGISSFFIACKFEEVCFFCLFGFRF